MLKTPEKPPIYTATTVWLGWTLDRTANLPKSHRYTFGERVDRLTLDSLERVIEAIYAGPEGKTLPLRALNMNLEKLRVLWRLIQARGWISQQQLLFVNQAIDEIGRMTGGWLRQVEMRNRP